MGFGILVIFLALFNFLPDVLVDEFNWIIKLMNTVIGWVARQEGFIIKNIPFDSIQMILGYFIIIVLVIFLSKPKWKIGLVLFSGIIAFQGWTIWSQVQAHQKESIILAHRSRNTVLLHQLGDSLSIITSDSTNIGSIANDYAVAERVQKVDTSAMQNSYYVGEKRLFVMDSLGILPLEGHLDYLLLTQSPEINLERVLDSIQPIKVFADGSNYPSMINAWKATCIQKEIPFHYTGEKGYNVFSLKKN